LLAFTCLCRYDTVTVNGDLDWQDKLNKYNKPFFDVCDGLFSNYTWQVVLSSYFISLTL